MKEYVLGALQFYGALLADTPRHFWRAMNVLGQGVFVVAIVTTLVFGVRGDVAPEWILAAAALLVLVAIAKANYDRHLGISADLAAVRAERRSELDRRIVRHRSMYLSEEREALIRAGSDDIWVPLTLDSDGDGDEAEWAAKIDEWEAATRHFLRTQYPDLVDEYDVEPELVQRLSEWRPRYAAYMHVKLRRLTRLRDADEFSED